MIRLLRLLMIVATAVWLGGMVLIPIVAQTTFETMRTVGLSAPDAIAGQVMAKNFRRFDLVQAICAGILIVSQVFLLALARNTIRNALRLVLIGAAAGLMAYSALVLTPRITNLQADLTAPDAEARVRAAFDEFHDSARQIGKVNLLLLTALLIELTWAATWQEKKPQVKIVRTAPVASAPPPPTGTMHRPEPVRATEEAIEDQDRNEP